MNTHQSTAFPSPDPNLEARARSYAQLSNITIDFATLLGKGNDGDAEWKEMFGPERYRKMRAALTFLEGLGIYYTDPNPGNIMFGDKDDPY